jgi:hypothetical protein
LGGVRLRALVRHHKLAGMFPPCRALDIVVLPILTAMTSTNCPIDGRPACQKIARQIIAKGSFVSLQGSRHESDYYAR